jgi:hypothetical protein
MASIGTLMVVGVGCTVDNAFDWFLVIYAEGSQFYSLIEMLTLVSTQCQENTTKYE